MLDIFLSTNNQKVLKFLLENAGQPFYEREIARNLEIGTGSANRALGQLYENKIIEKKISGNRCYYYVNTSNPYLKEFKIFLNLLKLEPLVNDLKVCTDKIILFGSAAFGENTPDSDMDIYISASEENKVRVIINSFQDKFDTKIQAIIDTPIVDLDEIDDVFLEQVNKGKVLWERPINDNEF